MIRPWRLVRVFESVFDRQSDDSESRTTIKATLPFQQIVQGIQPQSLRDNNVLRQMVASELAEARGRQGHQPNRATARLHLARFRWSLELGETPIVPTSMARLQSQRDSTLVLVLGTSSYLGPATCDEAGQ